jgi:YVTN family beta-propeller protein
MYLGAVLGAAGCYTSGDGTAPPPNTFYFPVGLAVSSGGTVLYVVNSDFDLQWNGGTLQSYDLNQIRRDTVLTIQDATAGATLAPDGGSILVNPAPPAPYNCPGNPPLYMTNNSGQRQPLGQTCAPRIDSTVYVRDSVVVGAFATDLQLSVVGGTRLFSPVRGDTSLTWADVVKDDPLSPPVPAPDGDQDMCASNSQVSPFTICCGLRVNGRCAIDHQAGNRCAQDQPAGGGTCEPGNTRFINMGGEPFGLAQTDDGTAVVVTHQTSGESSLFLTGLGPNGAPSASTYDTPSLQFEITGIDNGGNGIALVPHDPAAFTDCSQSASGVCPRPAFLQTSRYISKVDLLRYYSDQDDLNSSSLLRPFLVEETAFSNAVNANGSDSRGIAIDPTPRMACEGQYAPGTAQYMACARLPARVFIANRAPESLILGEVGQPSPNNDGTYDADQVAFLGNIPLLPGPSRVYLAPIVDTDGNYSLRVFIVCFDSNTIVVYDPNANAVEAIISVGPGPFAMAFDPFTLNAVALRAMVKADPRWPNLNTYPGTTLKTYRFAYVASFTDSYVQLIDLDNSGPDKSTFETIVYTLGTPTLPKGTQ